MSNNLRTRNGMPFNFVNGLKVRGMDIESLLPGIEGIPEAGSKYQFAGDGTNKSFTLPVSPYNKDAVDVYVKQLYVHPDDYTLVGDTVTLVEAPPAVVAGETYNVVIKVSLTTLNGYVNANRVSFEGENLDDILEKGKPIANYSNLRAYAGAATQVRITDPGIAGFFYYDASDTTSTDNGGTIIVSSNGRRWKRLFEGAVSVKWFGAKGNGIDDDVLPIQAAINASLSNGTNGVVYFSSGIYNVSKNLRIFSGQSLIGESITSTAIVKTTSTADNYGAVLARSGTVSDNYNVDSVISIIATENNFSRFNRIENLSITRTLLGTNSYSIFAPRFAYSLFRNLNLSKATYGIYSYQLFLTSVEDVMAQSCTNGFYLTNDGSGAGGSTSLTLKRFYFNADSNVASPLNGIYLYGLNYSNLISCAVDGLRPIDPQGAGTAYWFIYCRGVVVDGCGTEGVRGFVIRVSGGSVVVNGLRAGPIYGAAFTATVAARYIESASRVTFNNCAFDTITDPGNIYNNVIHDGSHVTDVNTPPLLGGNAFNNYTTGSTLSQINNGILTTQDSTSQKTAVYSPNTVSQTTLAAGTSSVSGGGMIETGVIGGLSSKFVIVQVRVTSDTIPTVAAHVTETYSTGGLMKIRFTNLSDGTQNYGTHNVNWCVMA